LSQVRRILEVVRRQDFEIGQPQTQLGLIVLLLSLVLNKLLGTSLVCLLERLLFLYLFSFHGTEIPIMLVMLVVSDLNHFFSFVVLKVIAPVCEDAGGVLAKVQRLLFCEGALRTKFQRSVDGISLCCD